MSDSNNHDGYSGIVSGLAYKPNNRQIYDALVSAVATRDDYPEPGIKFFSLNPTMLTAVNFRNAVMELDELSETLPLKARNLKTGREIDKILAPEARGFIWGTAMAVLKTTGLVPARKNGKNLLPPLTLFGYSTEYSTDTLGIESNAIAPGDQILIVDDVLATGGTLEILAKTVEELGGMVVGVVAVMDLIELGGAPRLLDAGYDVRTLMSFHLDGTPAETGIWGPEIPTER